MVASPGPAGAAAGAWRLSPATPADADALHRLLSLPLVHRYLLDAAPPPRAMVEAWLAASRGGFAGAGYGLWLLRRPDRPAAGLVRLVSDAANPGAAELTYALAPDLWGQGLATRMAWSALAHAFNDPRIARVWAGADRPNHASIAVMRRLGMRFWRDVAYALGPGVEYHCWRSDPPPDPIPAKLPLG